MLGDHPDRIPGTVEELLRTTPSTVLESAQPRRAAHAVELGVVQGRKGIC